MILYHGSYLEITKPDLKYSRANVDFGRGFYTTPIYEQAVKWCGKFKRSGRNGIVSHYEFDEAAYEELDGQDNSGYDIVVGGVANDKVFNTVELYFSHLIDKGEAIKRLRYEKPNLQVCFRTEIAIEKYLYFRRSEQV